MAAAQKARNIFRRLVGKVLSGKANSEEETFVNAYYRHFEQEEGYMHQLTPDEKEALGNQLFNNLSQSLQQTAFPVRPKPVYRIVLRRTAAAAAVLLIITGALFYYTHSTVKTLAGDDNSNIHAVDSLMPGINKAILTLSDGKKIVLDSSGKGVLAQQGPVSIIKQSAGSLTYNTGDGSSTETAMNTIQTPRGGQFSIMLGDGSRVWLNAASQLKFPVSFTGKERIVELNGEAYFEVAHRTGQPFKVKTKQQEVEVLGTHFNVMAYDDEPMVQTTLLQGKVQVQSGAQTRVLAPGQQSEVSNQRQMPVTVRAVNPDHYVAWKNGSFSFDNTDIYTMMRQISRWYNIDVHFKDSLNLQFNGSLKRNVNAATLFKMLTLTGEVKFTVANGILTIEKR